MCRRLSPKPAAMCRPTCTSRGRPPPDVACLDRLYPVFASCRRPPVVAGLRRLWRVSTSCGLPPPVVACLHQLWPVSTSLWPVSTSLWPVSTSCGRSPPVVAGLRPSHTRPTAGLPNVSPPSAPRFARKAAALAPRTSETLMLRRASVLACSFRYHTPTRPQVSQASRTAETRVQLVMDDVGLYVEPEPVVCGKACRAPKRPGEKSDPEQTDTQLLAVCDAR